MRKPEFGFPNRAGIYFQGFKLAFAAGLGFQTRISKDLFKSKLQFQNRVSSVG